MTKGIFQIIVASFLFVSCGHLKTRQDVRNKEAARSSELDPHPSEPDNKDTDQPVIEKPNQNIPRIGLILGPGAARSYAHIGFLQQWSRYKMPTVAIAGVEWGAVVAGIYSMKNYANDVEWQMFKLKPEEIQKKPLIGSTQAQSIRNLDKFLQAAFGKNKAEEAKTPFACPAYNIAKNQTFMMSRGIYTQLLPYCMAYPPLFEKFNSNVSAMREIKMVSDYLKSRGANYIVFVNVLGVPGTSNSLLSEGNSAENILWSEIAGYYAKPLPGVDYIISLPLDGYPINDFERSRDIMRSGAELSTISIKALAEQIGL